MQILRNQALTGDPWRFAPDGTELPAGPVLVSLPRWTSERARLLERVATVGVRLAPGDEVADLAPDLPRIPVVAIEFPSLTEGRGYSQARLLRDRHGYAGEVRAMGRLQRDQIDFLIRCGVDAIEVGPEFELDEALLALREITVRYQ